MANSIWRHAIPPQLATIVMGVNVISGMVGQFQLDASPATCKGCHEHAPADIRRSYVEKDIRDFDNCVEYSRGADFRAAFYLKAMMA